MNVREVNDWVQQEVKKDKATLIASGVDQKNVDKVIAYLKMTAEQASVIVQNLKKNATYTENIESYLVELKKRGLSNVPEAKNTNKVLPDLSKPSILQTTESNVSAHSKTI